MEKLLVLKLVKAQLAYIKKYNIGINTKDKYLEHTNCIGIIIGINL